MPSIAKPSKKADIKSKKLSSKGKAPAISVEPPQPVAEDSDEQSGDDDSGVDEEGMKKLMKALGDDGLDDYEQAQLIALMGDEEEEEVDEEDEREPCLQPPPSDFYEGDIFVSPGAPSEANSSPVRVKKHKSVPKALENHENEDDRYASFTSLMIVGYSKRSSQLSARAGIR